jgi:hypothetical protein
MLGLLALHSHTDKIKEFPFPAIHPPAPVMDMSCIVHRFEELILKDSLLAKVNRIRNEYRNSNRSRRQITKIKVLTTREANARIAQHSENENQQWVRRVRRENAKKLTEKLAEEERIAKLRGKAIAGSEIDRHLSLLTYFSKILKGIAH